jgi:hypothetical protein
MMSKIFYIFLFCLFSFLLTYKEVKAHGGRTDSSGCHNCRTGACAGEYHCHGGGGYVAPQIQIQPVVTPSLQPVTVESPKPQIQDYKPLNNNTENTNNLKEVQKQNENNQNDSNPVDSFIMLASILGSLGLGYFIYGIFNRS